MYKTIDPTGDYPKQIKDLPIYTKQVLQGKPIKKFDDPSAHDAFAKYLGVKSDKEVLRKNSDGSFSLPLDVEKQLTTDTTLVKNRIKEGLDVYPDLSLAKIKEIDPTRFGLIQKDKEFLNKLRNFHKGDTIVVNEYDVWKGRNINNINTQPSPFNVLKNFSIYKNSDGSTSYFDIYDFNQFEKIMPGKPFKINGIIKN